MASAPMEFFNYITEVVKGEVRIFLFLYSEHLKGYAYGRNEYAKILEGMNQFS